MNYLKTYESYSSQEILDTISDILLDIEDDGFDAEVTNLSGYVASTSGIGIEYRILIKKNISFDIGNSNMDHLIFNYNDVKVVMERLLEYLKINGINTHILVYNDSHWCFAPSMQQDDKRIKATKIIFRLK